MLNCWNFSVSDWKGTLMHHSVFYFKLCMQKIEDFKSLSVDDPKFDTRIWCWGGGHLQSQYVFIVQNFEGLVLDGVLVLASSTLQLPPRFVGFFQCAIHLAGKYAQLANLLQIQGHKNIMKWIKPPFFFTNFQ